MDDISAIERLKALDEIRLLKARRDRAADTKDWTLYESLHAPDHRSENGDYIYGKRRLREIDSRVRFLTLRLDELEVVDRIPANQQKIFFGAWVTVEDEAGKQQSYRIVGPDEFDLSKGKLSMDSPLAKAMLGKSLHEDIVFKTPEGDRELYICEVKYQP